VRRTVVLGVQLQMLPDSDHYSLEDPSSSATAARVVQLHDHDNNRFTAFSGVITGPDQQIKLVPKNDTGGFLFDPQAMGYVVTQPVYETIPDIIQRGVDGHKRSPSSQNRPRPRRHADPAQLEWPLPEQP
jgi:hypothetical protein